MSERFWVSRTGDRFDTNENLTDEETPAFIRQPLEGFVEWNRQLQRSSASPGRGSGLSAAAQETVRKRDAV